MSRKDETSPADELVTSKRVFINHVDQYNGLNIAKYLSGCVIGATLDEEENEEKRSDDGELSFIGSKEGCYEIIGTVKDDMTLKPDFVLEFINSARKDDLYEYLLSCDIILYDITRDVKQIDEAVWAVSELQADLEKISTPKIFVLISSVLTWAKTKPTDADEPDIPFTEEDYRRRKSHPNFKEQLSAEKTVIKLGKATKKKLNTYVVASGLIYGVGEDIFHDLFKRAWHNEPHLTCLGNGTNIVPTIHIKDLAAIIQNIADSAPTVKYIIAKDDSMNTLQEIVKNISQMMTTGKVVNVKSEESLLDKLLTQLDFDMLQVDLLMDAVFIKDNMKINWVAETGLVENISEIVKEYKIHRKLLPLRVCVLGPPGVGKSSVVDQLCHHYKLHHVKVKDVIDEYIQSLIELEQHANSINEQSEEQEIDEEEELRIQDAVAKLEEINECREQNNQRLDDNLLIMMMKEKLLSKPCQNQGFILDGFPKTFEQSKLFEADEEEEVDEKDINYNKNIMPEFIFSLEANDEFLHKRNINLPESVVAGTHNTEEGFTRRLTEFRRINTEDNTVLNYFDELEFHPIKIDVMKDTSGMMNDTVQKIKEIIKNPRNYGPTKEELEQIQLAEERELHKKKEEERILKEKLEMEEEAERKVKEKEWANKLFEVKQQEFEQLEARSIPLRNYLMKHVMPTLSKGLIDCCKVRPDDPVDYLAEYLFKNNPQID